MSRDDAVRRAMSLFAGQGINSVLCCFFGRGEKALWFQG